MQGACVFAMMAAMHGGISFEKGAVVESSFHHYRMVRADNFPEVVPTHIVPHPFAAHGPVSASPGCRRSCRTGLGPGSSRLRQCGRNARS